MSVRELFLIPVFVCREEFEEFCTGLFLNSGWAPLAAQVGRCAVVDEEDRVGCVWDLGDEINSQTKCRPNTSNGKSVYSCFEWPHLKPAVTERTGTFCRWK